MQKGVEIMSKRVNARFWQAAYGEKNILFEGRKEWFSDLDTV
jgi:hypothetical protein